MSRRLTLLGVALALLCMPLAFAHASHSNNYNYDYLEYRVDAYNVDNSINRSFNNYDSFNYTYGYPQHNVSYAYPQYDYSGQYYSGDYHAYAYDHKPTCTISAYDTNGSSRGGGVTVSWASSYATSASLSGAGAVALSGSQTFYEPLQGYYTLTVNGPGGSTSCFVSNPRSYVKRAERYGYTYAYPLHTYAAYTNPGYVYPTYVQLSQIPYTGFDFGAVGNALYWLAMILVAVCGAYAIVYSHSGAYPRMFVSDVVRAARNQARLVRSLVQ